MDSGVSVSIIHDSFVRTNQFYTRKMFANKRFTLDGSFLTSCKTEVKIKVPEVNFMARISNSNYNVIFGQN